jgi:MATE family multidrug resistance protein
MSFLDCLVLVPFSTRVSNKLGAGHHQAAKLAMWVVMCMALSSGFVLTLAMTLLRHVWGHMYSNDQEVVSYYAKMLPVLGISFFVDGLHASLSGKI